ncbi:hypothetical protein BN871_GE_00080 [Paenibacillus sp. P22]|nr:hypothetical protein BN871_GE_00080 [Paenibacillus sp. P22]
MADRSPQESTAVIVFQLVLPVIKKKTHGAHGAMRFFGLQQRLRSIHVYIGARNVGGQIGCQISDEIRDLGSLARLPGERMGALGIFHRYRSFLGFLGFDRAVVDMGVDRPRTNGVHPDLMRGELQRSHLHEGDLPGFGGAVSAGAGIVEDPVAVDGARNDDAAAVFLEMRNAVLHREERAAQIDAKRLVPIVHIQVLDRRPHPVDAGVREHDVDSPETLVYGTDASLDRSGVADVGRRHDSLSAFALDFVPDFLGIIRCAVQKTDLRSMTGKIKRGGSPDAGATSCNDRHFSFQQPADGHLSSSFRLCILVLEWLPFIYRILNHPDNG